jgi:hypothetical protein
MARSPLVGGYDRTAPPAPGHDTPSLGPSDTSDSGSDVAGLDAVDDEDPGLLVDTATDADSQRTEGGAETFASGADSDGAGTGERRSAAGDAGAAEGADIGPDRIVDDPSALGLVDTDSERALQEVLSAEGEDEEDEDEEDEDEADGNEEEEGAAATDEKVVRGAEAAARQDDDAAAAPRGKPLRLHAHPLRAVRGRRERPRR